MPELPDSPDVAFPYRLDIELVITSYPRNNAEVNGKVMTAGAHFSVDSTEVGNGRTFVLGGDVLISPTARAELTVKMKGDEFRLEYLIDFGGRTRSRRMKVLPSQNLPFLLNAELLPPGETLSGRSAYLQGTAITTARRDPLALP